ncbi:fumarylacetoacetate hydrolase family protein [Blastopirellula marina]|uniref:Fumarylacetoacetate hydrolase family protein n=1 Tax=Blastopirellula marina DSM 3645 TaxID=314230 RepID=A3ZYZ3_9BACT|nr:fumarylacetoacetate hydrolase family protein [Blastopirellula marina]EAQ78358.1 fumarylacetoacetate hydrolase family protein [Blastopirellula marina DSM 3645]
MQLVQFGPLGKEKPGLLTSSGARKDLSSVFDRYDREFFQSGGLGRLAELSGALDTYPDVAEDVRWGAPIARPGKVVCIGLNYADHATESGMPIPEEPIIFFKAANTVVGPYDDVLIPRKSEKTDWEVELGVVIGKEARYLESVEDAAAHIAGYCISHDVSERHFQLERGGQWVKGKSCDTFNPLGPFLATSDEVANVNDLAMLLDVNGERMQTGNTRTMIFDPHYLVYYLSQFMTLEAGDLLSTGTPPGVGLGMKPPRFLKSGDAIKLSIAGLGEQRQVCKNA